MPNKKGNTNNSPIIGDGGILATTSEINALTRNMRENFLKDISRPKIDLHNVDEVKQAIMDYLIDCEQSGKRPANMGLYRALDLTRQDVSNILGGKVKNKVSPECLDILQKALSMLSEYREQLAIKGKLNPVTLIFWQKNYDGLTDSSTLHVTSDRNERETMSPDEVARQIEQDIPIETDYKELDN